MATLCMEAAFLTLFLLVIVFYSVLVSKVGFRTDYLFFVAFTIVYAISFLLESRLLYVLGFDRAAIERFSILLVSMTPIPMLSLVTVVTGAPFGFPFYLLVTATLIFTALKASLPLLTSLAALTGAWKVLLAILGIYYILLSVRAVIARREDSIPVLTGVLAYVVGSRIEKIWGLILQDYSMGIFILCMLYALTSRHARLQSRLVTVSSKLLDAHEEERSRIARDIHDSIGQSLLALKMRVQMLASRVSAGGEVPSSTTFDSVAGDISGIIEEVRRTSMDLRPSFTGEMTFFETVNWYAGVFTDRSRIEVHIHGGEEKFQEPPPRVKDNLYRILQEALANTARHAKATRIDISLYRTKGRLVMKVADDGIGSGSGPGNRKGIGLSTIRERAELLGGSCAFTSSPGKGMTVTIEVPLP
jgi:signal transduction histidine kinase